MDFYQSVSFGQKEYMSMSRAIWSMTMPERIYNPITAMGFFFGFSTFQLDNTKM